MLKFTVGLINKNHYLHNMETQDKKRKQILKRLYVSCPVCGSVIMQAEGAKNALMKCEKCRFADFSAWNILYKFLISFLTQKVRSR